MPTSYQPGGARVNTPKSPTPTTAASDASTTATNAPIVPRRDAPRDTATFVPYYWEAYNEMVQPRRFDWYLIRRWLKDLGPLGFAIVKALRNRCYHNPLQGVLRNECEVDMDELAEEIGVSRPTMFREFAKNQHLAHFVKRERQYVVKEGRWYKDSNIYQVCMDDPIHPSDMVAYDDLRATKEAERAAAEAAEAERQAQKQGGKPAPPRVKNGDEEDGQNGKSQNDTYVSNTANDEGNRKSQNDTYSADTENRKSQDDTTPMSSQNDTTPMSSQIDTSYVDLPSGGLLSKDSLTRIGAAPVINNDPQGVKNSEPERKLSPLEQVWNKAKPALEACMTIPTFRTHIESLVPLSLSPVVDAEDGRVEIVLNCPSAFTREWVDKRHVGDVEAALAAQIGCPVTVRFTQIDHDKTSRKRQH